MRPQDSKAGEGLLHISAFLRYAGSDLDDLLLGRVRKDFGRTVTP